MICSAGILPNVTNFSRKAKKKDTKTRKDIFCKMPALPQARDCGKIIKKLLNHFAIIILRIHKRIENRFIFASQCMLFFFDFAGSKKLAALGILPAPVGSLAGRMPALRYMVINVTCFMLQSKA